MPPLDSIATAARACEAPGQRRVRIHGQESFVLRSDTIELYLTEEGACLGPVTFFADSDHPIQPYAVAPWAEEPLGAEIPPVLKHLRGDWMCSAFGANDEPWNGKQLPPHGETANNRWMPIDGGSFSAGSWIRLAVDLPVQGGRCDATTSIRSGESVVYQTHRFSGLTGPINPGHHATLRFPEKPSSGRISFSRHMYAATSPEPTEVDRARGRSSLLPGVQIQNLRAAPCTDGRTTNLLDYPARRGSEDVVIVCADLSLPFAWSAVTFSAEGYVWFALRRPEELTSTLLWFSNGGRHYPPWNSRHANVMGIEDVTAYFATGIAPSCRNNALTARGVQTCLMPHYGELNIRYIQGVARVLPHFDRVVAIDQSGSGQHIVMRSDSGAQVQVPCSLDFLCSGVLPVRDPL